MPEVVAAGSEAATAVLLARGRSGDVGRALLGLLGLRLERCQSLPRQGGLAANPGDGLALPRHGGREPCRARARVPRGRCRAGRAAPPASPAAPSSLRPFSAASRASRSFCAVARARPVDPGHDLVDRGRAQDHRDRVGLALDVELAQQGADPPLRRGERAAHDLGSQRRVGLRPGELARTRIEARPARPARGRVRTPPRRAGGARTTRSCRSAPACLATIGPVCAAPIVGIDPVKRMPLRTATPRSGHVVVSGLTRRRP